MIRRLSSLSVGAALLMLAAGATTLRGETRPQDIYQKVLPSVMMLEVVNDQGERFVGSAVLALDDDVAVTAWHVVSDAREVWANFSDGRRVKVVGCIDHDAVRDLAVMKLELKFPERRAVLCQDLQPVAARAYVIGAPKGYGFSISDGLISQVRRVDGFSQYQVSCPISSGNSGGPVLNDRGEVMGIASWTKADAQNVSFAIPARELERLDITRRPVNWDDMKSRKPSSLQRQSVEPSMGVRAGNGEAGFADLKKRLQQAAGKSVTVIVRENGQENKFSFTVPPGGLK